MIGWKIFDLLKKHFKYEHDESFFYADNSHKNFKEPRFDTSKPMSDIRNVNHALNNIKTVKDDIDWLHEFGNSKDIDVFKDKLDDALYELSDVSDTINKLIEAEQETRTWGADWKGVALELFNYMLEKHPEEIDEIGINMDTIDANIIKSVQGIDKFNL